MYTKTIKLLLLFIVLFTFESPVIFAQTKDEIEKGMQDSISFKVLYEFDQRAEKDGKLYILTDTMALKVGKHISVYYDWQKIKRDSLVSEFMSNEIVNKGKQISVVQDAPLESKLGLGHQKLTMFDESKGETLEIFKNRFNNEIISIEEGPVDNNIGTKRDLMLIETIPFQNWKITEDTMTVLNYLCYKATTSFRGREYVAWFTLDIPVNEGPWKLYGLPGLILKVEDTNYVFRIEAVGIQQLENEKIEIPNSKGYVSSTLKELNLFRKNKHANISQGIFNDYGLTIYKIKNPIKRHDMELEKE